MTNRYRGTLYVGVASNLPARIDQHHNETGSKFCREHNLTKVVWADHIAPIDPVITYEKRIRHWHRDWKIDMIERTNPDWRDLYGTLVWQKQAGPRIKSGVT